MSGPIVFAPPFRLLVDAVATHLAAQGVTAVVARGWKARAEQINQGSGRANRVVFMGSKPDGSAGEIVNPRQGRFEIGDDPAHPDVEIRPLADWVRSLQVSVWAYDGANANDEGKQDDALWALFTSVQQAVQAAGVDLNSIAVFTSVKVTVPLERSFGLELIADLTFQHMIPDAPLDITRPSPVVKRTLP